MKIITFVLVSLLSLLLAINSANSYQTAEIDNWIEFCPTSQLCFDRPASLKPADIQMIDSLAGQLENANIVLYYDLGLYASTFNELSSATSTSIIVDGNKGRILTFQNTMALTIEQISDNVRFSMLLEFKGKLQPETAEHIFKSVKFNL